MNDLEEAVVMFTVAVLKSDAVPAEYADLPEWVREAAEELVAVGVRLAPDEVDLFRG